MASPRQESPEAGTQPAAPAPVERLHLPPTTLLVLCGASGTGKSTFARSHFSSSQVVCSDACRAMIVDDPYDQSVSAEAFELAYFIIELRLKQGRFTVFDATSVTPESRSRLLEIAQRHNFETALVAFDTPREVCFARDRARSRPVGSSIIERQLGAFRRSLQEFSAEGWTKWVILGPVQAERTEVVIDMRPGESP